VTWNNSSASWSANFLWAGEIHAPTLVPCGSRYGVRGRVLGGRPIALADGPEGSVHNADELLELGAGLMKIVRGHKMIDDPT
jgi:hypothetical protein